MESPTGLSKPLTRRRIAQAVLLALGAGAALPAIALPTGGEVSAGQAAISQSGGRMTIHQATPKAAINWQGFSIGAQESVQFVQPGATAIALNRVLGQDPSLVLGQLSANGQVFLLNPNGVLFGPGAQVNVGGIVASTLSLSDEDFLAGRYRFAGAGSGSVVNQGAITATEGGYVALLASQVANEGVIAARLGTVALAAGEQVTLTLSGQQLLSVAVDRDAVAALAANRQLIQADGGRVILTASARDALLDTVVNNSGVIEARSVSVRNGVVTLDGGASGVTAVSGVIDTSGTAAGETGGRVVITGDKVALMPGARIDASGDAGGGTVLAGGGVQGRDPAVRNAGRVFMAADATVRADALSAGDGGTVVVWGTAAAQAHGMLSARGGAESGDGGFIETSGRYLDADGARVDASAPAGRAGVWLLDPYNVTISAAATGNTDNNANAAPDWNATGNTATVQASQIAAKLDAGTSVTITTGDGSGAQDGDITVAASILKSAGGDAALTLRAHDQITLNANVEIASTSGRLDVTLNSDLDATGGGSITLLGGSAIRSNGGDVVLGGGANPAATAAMGGATSTAYGVLIDGTTIDSAGGAISIRGEGRSGAPNTVTARHGVIVQGGGVVTSGGGAISVVGRGGVATGGAGRDANYGVFVTGANSRIESAAGAVSVAGTGGGNRNNNYGVYLTGANARIASITGAVAVTGTSQGTGTGNEGVRLEAGSRVESTGGGAVAVTGTGGAGTAANYGVRLLGANTRVAGTTGAVSVTGTGQGTGANNAGVRMETASAVQTTSGAISVTGTGGNGTNTNYGVHLLSNNTRISSTTGAVTVTGAAQGLGTNNMGVRMDNTSAVQSVDGNIAVIGTGGGGTNGNDRNAHGVFLSGGNAKVAATGTGSVTITGAGGTAGTGNTRSHGVVVTGANTRVETSAGDIAVTGTGAATSGAQNYGVFVTGGNARLASTGGGITVTGTGGTGTNDNYGVYVNGNGARIETAAGDIDVTGTGRGTGTNNHGVRLQGGSRIDATAGGDVTVTGTGGAGTNNGYGVFLLTNNTRISTTTGDLTVTGTAGGTGANNIGVRMDNTSALQTVDGAIAVAGTGAGATTGNHGVYLRGGNAKAAVSGTGSVSITGTAGSGTNDNVGVRIDQNDTRIETVSGDVAVTGSGNGSGVRNYGVFLFNNGSRVTSTSGDVAVTGTGGNGTNDNYGVYLTGTATRFASGDGDVTVTGTGQGSGTNNNGVRLNTSAQITSTGAGTGTIAVTGTGAGTAPGFITTGTGTLIGAATHAGDIVISAGTASGADSISLTGGAIRGTGNLFLQPIDPASTFGLAGAAGTFNLSAAELAQIQDGFDRITIGRADGSGAMVAGAYTWNADLRLRGATSNITLAATTLPAPAGNDTGTLTLDTGGSVTQTGAIGATNLALLGAGGSHALTNAANSVGTLAADTGTVDFFNAGALTIGTVDATAGVTTTGDARIVNAAGNDVTLAGNVASTGGDVVIASGQNIHYGTSTLSAGGRWLTYSIDPAQNTGTIPAPGNPKPNLYNRTFAGNPPPSITEPGNHHIYSIQPLLTVTADDQAKLYGEPVPVLTASITGLLAGDTAVDAYSGAPALSTTATATSPVAGSPYTISAAPGSLASDIGYAFAFVDGQLTVTPRPITVTADPGQTKVYGDPDPLPFAYTVAGGPGTTGPALVGGDTLGGALARVAGENVGSYAINQGTLSISAPGDYALTFVPANFVITPATLTYVADPASAFVGVPLPSFTGTVTGFRFADTLASATTGTLLFLTTAADTLTPGVYPVLGSGLTANNGNYVFVQAPGNATAFTVTGAGQVDALDAARAQRITRCEGEQGLADPIATLPCRVPGDRGEALPAPGATPWLAVEGGGVNLPPGVR